MKNKKDGIVIGFTSVVGDLLHPGHMAMLDECKQHCDYLYCGLICDPTSDRPFKNKPVQSVFERFYQVWSHRAVDQVIPLEGEDDLVLALKTLPIDIRFVGSDYIDRDFTGKQYCIDAGIKLYFNSRDHDLSSTELRDRIINAELAKRKIDIPDDDKKDTKGGLLLG